MNNWFGLVALRSLDQWNVVLKTFPRTLGGLKQNEIKEGEKERERRKNKERRLRERKREQE